MHAHILTHQSIYSLLSLSLSLTLPPPLSQLQVNRQSSRHLLGYKQCVCRFGGRQEECICLSQWVKCEVRGASVELGGYWHSINMNENIFCVQRAWKEHCQTFGHGLFKQTPNTSTQSNSLFTHTGFLKQQLKEGVIQRNVTGCLSGFVTMKVVDMKCLTFQPRNWTSISTADYMLNKNSKYSWNLVDCKCKV